MIIEFNGIKPDVEKAAFIAENAVIIGDVVLEEGSSIWFGAVLRGDSGRIHIGKNSNVQDNCVIHCDAGGCVEVGENVVIGHSAVIHGCRIGDGCMIGMGSILMNDSEIGDHCLVGAGTLITERKTFSDHSLILGRPAKKLMQVTGEHLRMMEAGAEEYLKFAALYQNRDPQL